MVKIFPVILAAFALSGCCPSYASAEKATLDVLEPAHRRYVEADENLTEEEKARRYRLLDSWRSRVETQLKAEGK